MSNEHTLDPARFISSRCNAVDASGIRKVFDLAGKMKDPINFSIGQPDYDVDEPVKQAAIAAIRAGHNGYTVTQGIAPLREGLTARLTAELGFEPAVLVVSGVAGGLFLSLMTCVNPGDEVIFLDPYFVMYRHLVNLVGGTPVAVDSYPDFAVPIDRVEAAITDRTKAIILNSPGNPTGVVFDADALGAVADLARRHDLVVISDEIYCDLSFDGVSPSPAPLAPERTILLRGFSKGHGMTGWRLGYAAGPQVLIEGMTKLQQFTYVCAPSIVQHAGVAALDVAVTGHVEDYTRQRDLVCAELEGRFDFVRPSGGFYVFPQAPAAYATASDFVEQAIERNVLIIPGQVFSARDTHFRISYATDDDSIRRGCAILRDLAS